MGTDNTIVERVKTLASRMPDLALLETEEATKNALVMPFIGALGYDVFNPLEVVPEFTADVGTKKGEKVDYAIKNGESVIILIECKRASEDLRKSHLSQLYRYFSVTKARIAVLTNGVVYRFYSDLEEQNKMDELPFLELDMRRLKDGHIGELTRLSKDSFDLETMLATASDLKYTGLIRSALERQFDDPDDEFVKFFFSSSLPDARFSKSYREQFVRLVKKALHEAVNDRVSLRLRSALEQEEIVSATVPAVTQIDLEVAPRSEIETTEEELQGYQIVKAIVCAVLSASRVTYRDSKTYFAVLCDDNNRKPICRLWFNSRTKYIGLLDEEKKETRTPIETLDEIYAFAEKLRTTAARYLEEAEDQLE